MRIVVCIDTVSDDPVESYRQIKSALDNALSEGIEDWESSDEWYDSDGNPLDTETVIDARMKGNRK